MKMFTGFYRGWNRCECGLPLKRVKTSAKRGVLTPPDTLVHLHGKYSQKSHDLVMRKKAEALAKAERIVN